MDEKLLFLINRDWTTPLLDRAMAVASSWDFWWPFLAVSVLLIVIFGGFRARAMVVCAVAAVAVTDALVVDNLKELVGRPRPHETEPGVRTLDLAKANPRFLAAAKPLREEYSEPGILPSRGNSFPSGHAANNFAIAAVVAAFFRRWGWLMFVPAAFVSYSRVYVGSHWPLDVLVSALIGAGIALVVMAAAEWAWQKLGRRWFSGLLASHPHLLES